MLTSRKSFPSAGLQTLFSRRVRHTRADKGVYSPRLGHLRKIRTTSLLRHFKKVHLNFHQFFFQNLSSVETYHLFKRKKLVKNHEYRIKYFKVHVLYDKQTIQNFVLRCNLLIPASVCPVLSGFGFMAFSDWLFHSSQL